MTDDETSQGPDTTKRTLVTISVAPDDAEKIYKAFCDGKLMELGIMDVELAPLHENVASPDKQQWTKAERHKRKRSDADASISPPNKTQG